jgi:hypothetical protein
MEKVIFRREKSNEHRLKWPNEGRKEEEEIIKPLIPAVIQSKITEYYIQYSNRFDIDNMIRLQGDQAMY